MQRRNFIKNALCIGCLGAIGSRCNFISSFETNAAFQKDNFIYNYKDMEKCVCDMLFETPQIDWNGDLLGCCSALESKFASNVFKDGLLKALNSPDFIYAKRMLTDLSTEAKPEIMCTKCKRYEYLRKRNIAISLS